MREWIILPSPSAGTVMTPNYLRSPKISVSPFCDCSNSGNNKDECDKLTEFFTENTCLRKFHGSPAVLLLVYFHQLCTAAVFPPLLFILSLSFPPSLSHISHCHARIVTAHVSVLIFACVPKAAPDIWQKAAFSSGPPEINNLLRTDTNVESEARAHLLAAKINAVSHRDVPTTTRRGDKSLIHRVPPCKHS